MGIYSLRADPHHSHAAAALRALATAWRPRTSDVDRPASLSLALPRTAERPSLGRVASRPRSGVPSLSLPDRPIGDISPRRRRRPRGTWTAGSLSRRATAPVATSGKGDAAPKLVKASWDGPRPPFTSPRTTRAGLIDAEFQILGTRRRIVLPTQTASPRTTADRRLADALGSARGLAVGTARCALARADVADEAYATRTAAAPVTLSAEELRRLQHECSVQLSVDSLAIAYGKDHAMVSVRGRRPLLLPNPAAEGLLPFTKYTATWTGNESWPQTIANRAGRA